MKGFRATGILFVLVGALAAYTFYEFKHAGEDAAAERGEVPAFTLKREEVESFKLTLHGTEIELRRDGDAWKMLKPVEDLAENATVDGFLLSTLGEKLKSLQSGDEAKNVKWTDYGLEPAPNQLEFSGKGRSEGLKLSGKTAYDGSYYVRKGDQLLLGASSVGQIATRSPGSFRSRKLWREPEGTTVESVVILSTAPTRATYKAVQVDGKWGIEPKPPFVIDSDRVSAWVQQWKDLMPNDFASDTLDEASKREFLLLKPSVYAALTLKRPDGSTLPWEVTIGQDKGEDVYLFTNQRTTIYKYSKAGLASLRVPVDYFRDGKKPFQFDVEQAHEVEVNSGKGRYTFVKSDSAWKIKGDATDLELDQDKLIRLFQNARLLEAAEYAPSVKATKLTPRFIVRNAKGVEIFSLSWGDETQPLKSWNQGLKYRWVRTNLEKEFMGLPKEKLDMLIDPDIVKKKLEAKPDTKPEKK